MFEMTPTQALKLIVKYQDMPALNYAVNYAKAGLQIADPNSHEFKIQCLYIVGNINNWRQTKASSVTNIEIREVRKTLRDICNTI